MAYTNCLTLRTVKGSALTHAELDNNFICLDTAISNVVSNVGSNFLPLSGGTLTGPLTACTGGVYVNDLFACDPNTGINVNGSVTIFGNVTVWGSATTFNTQIINTESNIIILNASGTTASAQGGGIVVHEGIGPGQDASIILSGSCWTFDPPLCLPPIVDTYVTGFTYSNNVITLSQNLGQPDLSITIDTMTGLTINGSFSASTYLGLPIDVYVTGGTYSNGVVTFTNNTGGTFNVDGFFTGGTGSCITDLYVTNIHGCSPITFWDNIQTNTSTAVGLYGISFGSKNINNSNYTSILGGESNTISNTSPYSSIIGGRNNTLTYYSYYSTIIGGKDNNINNTSRYSTIIGGQTNNLNGSNNSFIGNGNGNTIISSQKSSIVGGTSNSINGSIQYASILGGNGNTISMSNSSSIVGGSGNYITNNSNYSSIIGGKSNLLRYSSSYSSIVGGLNNLLTTYSSFSSIVGGQGNVITQYSDHSFIVGGQNNRVSNYSQYATIVGGKNNLLTYSSSYSFIGAGSNNGITYTTHASIGGGISNNIQGYAAYASIGGGSNNNIENYSHTSFIGGGKSNTISNYSQYSFIGGGWNNKVYSYHSSIVGGINNTVISGISNTHIIGSGIIATVSNTTYVENLNIKNITTGITVYNLGIDVNGNVIGTTSGSTGGGNISKYITTSGFTGSVTQTINHGLSTIYISVSVWDNTTGDLIYPQVNRVDANNVNITVATTGTYDILITG